ncbi:MAG: DUF2489 domain-containing protein [Shewanella sp.]
MTILLTAIGFIIIIPLAGYAIALLLKLHNQSNQKKKHQQELTDKNQDRLNEHLSSIRYIATAMLEDRCELSEGVMRIAKLFCILSMSEQVETQYPAIFKHFAVIQDHPIMDKRKILKKQLRMKLDFARIRSEAELEVNILEEAQRLTHFTPNPLH